MTFGMKGAVYENQAKREGFRRRAATSVGHHQLQQFQNGPQPARPATQTTRSAVATMRCGGRRPRDPIRGTKLPRSSNGSASSKTAISLSLSSPPPHLATHLHLPIFSTNATTQQSHHHAPASPARSDRAVRAGAGDGRGATRRSRRHHPLPPRRPLPAPRRRRLPRPPRLRLPRARLPPLLPPPRK